MQSCRGAGALERVLQTDSPHPGLFCSKILKDARQDGKGGASALSHSRLTYLKCHLASGLMSSRAHNLNPYPLLTFRFSNK